MFGSKEKQEGDTMISLNEVCEFVRTHQVRTQGGGCGEPEQLIFVKANVRQGEYPSRQNEKWATEIRKKFAA